MFTTPELEQRGLGYRSWWHNAHQDTDFTTVYAYSPAQSLTSVQGTTPPQHWHQPHADDNGQMVLSVHARVEFYKIGSGTQHATLPQNFSTYLNHFYAVDKNAQGAPFGTHQFNWQVTNFASRVAVRTCETPSASESLIHFGTVYEQDLNAPGLVVATQRDFTLTFTCPYAAYNNIWFYVEPTHGVANAADGVMGIASGSGMAQGVGVQLLLEDTVDSSNGYAALKYGANNRNRLPVFTVGDDWRFVDALTTPPRQQVVKFKAALYRLNEPLVAGQIKASALIHIRYP